MGGNTTTIFLGGGYWLAIFLPFSQKEVIYWIFSHSSGWLLGFWIGTVPHIKTIKMSQQLRKT